MKLNGIPNIKLQIDAILSAFPELAEDEILRADMLEGETDLFEYLRKIEQRRQESFGQAVALEMIIGLWKERKARFDRRDEGFRKLIFNLLQYAGLKKLEIPEATFSVRAGSQKVIITDEMNLPDELCRFKREPDKTKIKAALRDGPVPGAEWSNAEESLAIRIQ